MPRLAIETIRTAVVGGIALDGVPTLLAHQIAAVLRRAAADSVGGRSRGRLKLARLEQLRQALAEEEERWVEWPERSGRLEWMGVMLDEFRAGIDEPAELFREDVVSPSGYSFFAP